MCFFIRSFFRLPRNFSVKALFQELPSRFRLGSTRCQLEVSSAARGFRWIRSAQCSLERPRASQLPHHTGYGARRTRTMYNQATTPSERRITRPCGVFGSSVGEMIVSQVRSQRNNWHVSRTRVPLAERFHAERASQHPTHRIVLLASRSAWCDTLQTKKYFTDDDVHRSFPNAEKRHRHFPRRRASYTEVGDAAPMPRRIRRVRQTPFQGAV